MTIEKRCLSGEKKPFRELYALACNQTSSGPLLPRVGDLIEVPGMGNPLAKDKAKIMQVDFGRPLEEISKRMIYQVFLNVDSHEYEWWSKRLSDGTCYGWKLVSMSEETPNSFWIESLPGAKFFKPDYLDLGVKESEFESLSSMSKYEINSNIKKLSYLRHHYPEARKYLGMF